MRKKTKRTLPGVITLAMLVFTAPALADEAVEILRQYQDEIANLRADQRVRVAFDYAEAAVKRAEKELIELTEIPAPPFGEENRARRFAEMLREAGLEEVVIDAVGNVIGRRPGHGGNRVVAYSGHLDTVFPAATDVRVKHKDGKLYAPGIGDNSRGLVTVLHVLQALEAAAIKTDATLLFIGNVGEEGLGDLRGIKHLYRDDAETIDALIAIDGGSAERIVYGGVGSHRYRVTFKGPGGHSWSAFGLANPHHALGRAIAKFVTEAPKVTSALPKTSYNIGRIGGGTSINSIPFESWMEVDMRSGSQSRLDEIDAVFQTAMATALVAENAARLSGAEVSVAIQRVGTRPAGLGDARGALVQRAMAATQSFGITPALKISSTDANIPISKGLPAVTMSRGGSGGRAHSLDEWWQDDKGYISVQIGILTLLAEAGMVH